LYEPGLKKKRKKKLCMYVLINDLHRPGGIIENLPILEIEKEGLTDDLNQANRNKNIELCMQGFHKCFQ